MQETEATITDWANETFGHLKSNMRGVARANEEMAELVAKCSIDGNDPKMAEEIADIFIVLARVLTNLGTTLEAQVNRKMAINRERKWNLDGSGCAYHIKSPPSSPATVDRDNELWRRAMIEAATHCDANQRINALPDGTPISRDDALEHLARFFRAVSHEVPERIRKAMP